MSSAPKPEHNGQHSFSLIELAALALLAGMLAGAVVPVYLGSVRDPGTTEAKGVAAALWGGLLACAQAEPEATCTLASQYARAGLDARGVTADARWAATTPTSRLTRNPANGLYSATPERDLIVVRGQPGKDTAGVVLRFTFNNSTGVGTFTCDTGRGDAAC